MRSVRVLVSLACLLSHAGCGYVHFGRLPAAPPGGGDAALSTAYTNLAIDHKILKQELVLARKEGDTLRVALERVGAGAAPLAGSVDLATRLGETSRELAALRASYAKLQTERANAAPNNSAAVAVASAQLEEKLAVSLRNYTQLQEENSRLRGEVERTRAENATLAAQLKSTAAQAENAQSTVEQLNVELLAQKEARARSEQSGEAIRAQLNTVLAHRATPTDQRASAAAATSINSLQIAKAPPADSTPIAELRVDTERLRRALNSGSENLDAPARPSRVHIVQAGDTLEKLARQYFNAPDRWRSIYEANRALLSNGDPLRAGMELRIPAE